MDEHSELVNKIRALHRSVVTQMRAVDIEACTSDVAIIGAMSNDPALRKHALAWLKINDTPRKRRS